MRINEKMRVHEMADEHIVIEAGKVAMDMTKVTALNESALMLYTALRNKEFTVSDVVKLLLDTYDVDEATARNDAEAWVDQMRKNNFIL